MSIFIMITSQQYSAKGTAKEIETEKLMKNRWIMEFTEEETWMKWNLVVREMQNKQQQDTILGGLTLAKIKREIVNIHFEWGYRENGTLIHYWREDNW